MREATGAVFVEYYENGEPRMSRRAAIGRNVPTDQVIYRLKGDITEVANAIAWRQGTLGPDNHPTSAYVVWQGERIFGFLVTAMTRNEPDGITFESPIR